MAHKEAPKKGAPKIKHLGRRKAQIERYYMKSYPLHKLRRILRNNGVDAARSWAAKHGVTGILTGLLRETA